MTDTELALWQTLFEEPDDDELRGSPVPAAPAPNATWSQWAAQRWPSLADQYHPAS